MGFSNDIWPMLQVLKNKKLIFNEGMSTGSFAPVFSGSCFMFLNRVHIWRLLCTIEL